MFAWMVPSMSIVCSSSSSSSLSMRACARVYVSMCRRYVLVYGENGCCPLSSLWPGRKPSSRQPEAALVLLAFFFFPCYSFLCSSFHAQWKNGNCFFLEISKDGDSGGAVLLRSGVSCRRILLGMSVSPRRAPKHRELTLRP